MGNWNSGRRPTPSRLKVFRGTAKTIRPTEPQPPVADAAFDTPPTDLDGDVAAQTEWRRVAPMLRLCGLVSNAERAALTALCQQWSRVQLAQRHLQTDGVVVLNANGVLVRSPWLIVHDKALSQCIRLWVELGCTPSGRAKMSALPAAAAPPEAASKWAGLL